MISKIKMANEISYRMKLISKKGSLELQKKIRLILSQFIQKYYHSISFNKIIHPFMIIQKVICFSFNILIH